MIVYLSNFVFFFNVIIMSMVTIVELKEIKDGLKWSKKSGYWLFFLKTDEKNIID